jgi:competence protein ComEC
LPLFHAAWLFALGIVAASFGWLPPGMILAGLALAAVACVAAAVRTLRILWAPMAALWLLLGAWCAQMEPHPAPDQPLLALSDGLLRTVEGSVTSAGPVRAETLLNVDDPAASETVQTIDVHVATLEIVNDVEDAQAPVTGSVRLTVRWPQAQAAAAFSCGESIRAVVRLLPPEKYRDPGAWSRTDYLLDQGITATASVNSARMERTGGAGRRSVHCLLGSARNFASSRLLQLPAATRRLPAALRLSQNDAIMLSAMVTGDRTFLAHSLRVGFERTGSFHMLVVSGLHLAIVAGFVFWLARRLRIPSVAATLLTIGAAFAYALFTGFATPVQRSFWMVALYLVGRLVFRERNALNLIGFAALVLLAASPRSLFESGFQMTLLAVVAIAGVATPLLAASLHPFVKATSQLRLVAMDVNLPPRLAQFRVVLRMFAARLQPLLGARFGWRIFPWLIRTALHAAEAMVVTLVVELALTLPMAIYFHRITLFALPVNLFILPLLLWMLPLALITLFTLLLWPPLAVIPGAATALLLHFGVFLVHLFGSIRLADMRIPTPLSWQSAAFYALLGAAILLARSQRVGTRRAAWAALLCAALAGWAPRPVAHPRNALLMEAIDVGQGDSLLLITPDGKSLLVDGGGFGGGPRQAPQDFDIGEEVVSPALWARGIRRLDVVALSHAHSDHLGGLPAVLRNFHPAELWVGNNPLVPAYAALLDEAAALHTHVRTLRAGDSLQLGSVRFHVLAPLPTYRPGAEPANNDSLVLHAAYGATSILLEGDAEAPVEQAMLAEPGLSSTLLKVGHHGSVTSTQPAFLARVAPQWAVISCGLRNRYGHPRHEVLEELQAAHVRTFSTDIDGAVCFRLDGASVSGLPCVEDQNR